MEPTVISDRIEAGTFAIAAAMTGGDLLLKGTRARYLDALLAVLGDTGASVVETDSTIHVAKRETTRGDVTTDPFRLSDRFAGAVHGDDVYSRWVIPHF